MAKFSEFKGKYFEQFLDSKGKSMSEYGRMSPEEKDNLEVSFSDFARPLWIEEKNFINADGRTQIEDESVKFDELPMIHDKAEQKLEEIKKATDEKLMANAIEVSQLEGEGQEQQNDNSWQKEIYNLYDKNKGTSALSPYAINEEGHLDMELTKAGEEKPYLRTHFESPKDVGVDFTEQAGADMFIGNAKELGHNAINFNGDMTPEFKAQMMIACMKHGMRVKGNPKFEDLGITDENILKDYKEQVKKLEEEGKPNPFEKPKPEPTQEQGQPTPTQEQVQQESVPLPKPVLEEDNSQRETGERFAQIRKAIENNDLKSLGLSDDQITHHQMVNQAKEAIALSKDFNEEEIKNMGVKEELNASKSFIKEHQANVKSGAAQIFALRGINSPNESQEQKPVKPRTNTNEGSGPTITVESGRDL